MQHLLCGPPAALRPANIQFPVSNGGKCSDVAVERDLPFVADRVKNAGVPVKRC
jgi:hypothetical protein